MPAFEHTAGRGGMCAGGQGKNVQEVVVCHCGPVCNGHPLHGRLGVSDWALTITSYGCQTGQLCSVEPQADYREQLSGPQMDPTPLNQAGPLCSDEPQAEYQVQPGGPHMDLMRGNEPQAYHRERLRKPHFDKMCLMFE